jgi:histidinol-phosphatase (PHP family)
MTVSLRIDCHLHTAQFSCDASATLEEYVARGNELGLAALCTTEHVDFDPADYCYGHYDLAPHLAQREHVRAQQVDGMSVLIGAEVDYQKRFEPQIRQFMRASDHDFVLGSVHYVQGQFVMSRSFFERPERDAYLAYFQEVLYAVQSGLFDVLGHLDIVKRRGVRYYGAFDPARYAEAIDAILHACIDTGTGLEINTSGLRDLPQEPFPTLPVLQRYRELGGDILTVGSDVHRATDLASGIPDALALAQAAGFRAITLFVDRQPRWLPLT